MNGFKSHYRLFMFGILSLALLITGCEEQEGQIGTNGNQAPTAQIAEQPDIVSGESVNLDGTASSDPDGDPLTFSWTQLQGSSVDLQDTTSPSLSFVAPDISQTEMFFFQLTVNDGELSHSAEVSFQVLAESDTMAPSVVSRSPQADQVDVPVSTDITVTFDESLLPSSVNNTSLTLNVNGLSVSGSVSYDDGTNTIRFTPATALSANSQHTVTIADSIEDLAGNRVAVNSWSFTTAAEPPPSPVGVRLEGYGTSSEFGEGTDFETCSVTNLNDSGEGSLRDCVVNRTGTNISPVPRRVIFTVGGIITLLSDINLRQPYITIDGLTAPSPGITIRKQGDGTDGEFRVNTWPSQETCAHDVLVQGLRFVGVWDQSSEDHSQNTTTIGIDGEDYINCVDNIVFNRITITNAQDSAGDIWGSATNVTYQYSAFINSLHPQSHSHWPGGEAGQERRYISMHHNLYAYNHERQTNIRGNTWDYNFEQNIIHAWGPFGFGGGYGTQLRCRGSGCPERINMIDNYYTSSPATPNGLLSQAVLFNDGASYDQVYMEGNRFPTEENDMGSAVSEFPRSSVADITRYAQNELVSKVLPNIGVPYRTPEEEQLFSEVASQINSE